ncbi:hypothetical protein MKZ38_002485 [Zalerion maritima]|uniref:Uncharacterized protein n=1 Tax=Zalerion maritima TaxID=339359 RepID=A0AAD5WR89_9PEZI|nr:hypothetical protein MKZ38_002485 [Zalerion maritima]
MQPSTFLAIAAALSTTQAAVSSQDNVPNTGICPYSNRISPLFARNSRCGGQYRGPKPNATNPANLETGIPKALKANASNVDVEAEKEANMRTRAADKTTEAVINHPVVPGASKAVYVFAEDEEQVGESSDAGTSETKTNAHHDNGNNHTAQGESITEALIRHAKKQPVLLTQTTVVEIVLGTEQQHRESVARSRRRIQESIKSEIQLKASEAAARAAEEGGKAGAREIKLVGQPLANIQKKPIKKTVDLGVGFTGFPTL